MAHQPSRPVDLRDVQEPSDFEVEEASSDSRDIEPLHITSSSLTPVQRLPRTEGNFLSRMWSGLIRSLKNQSHEQDVTDVINDQELQVISRQVFVDTMRHAQNQDATAISKAKRDAEKHAAESPYMEQVSNELNEETVKKIRQWGPQFDEAFTKSLLRRIDKRSE